MNVATKGKVKVILPRFNVLGNAAEFSLPLDQKFGDAIYTYMRDEVPESLFTKARLG